MSPFHRIRVLRSFFGVLLLATNVAVSGTAHAHQIKAVAAKAMFERDGSYLFALSLEIQASPDPAVNDAISPEKAALDYLSSAVTLHFDNVVVKPDFTSLEPVQQETPLPGMDVVTQLYTETRGSVPEGTEKFLVRLSEESDVALVMVVFIDGVMQKRAHTLFAGEFSRPIDLSFIGKSAEAGDPIETEAPTAKAPGKARPTILADALAGARMLFSNDAKRVVLAVAVFLLATGFFRGIAQVIALALGLVFGQLLALAGQVPAWPFLGELVLGAGIALMAWSNLGQSRVTSVRFALVVLVGMMAGFCTHTGPANQLLGFLLGEVLALLGIFIVTWIVLGAFWARDWYRSLLVVPTSWIILGMGAFWTGLTLWEAGFLGWIEKLI